MDQMKRFAVFYAPRDGAFSTAAAAWLGWDAERGRAVPQPEVAGIAALTAEPRRYGFHGTLKPPFRLAAGVGPQDLAQSVAHLAEGMHPVEMPGLLMAELKGFLALIPDGDTAPLQAMAAGVVRALDGFRAPLSEAEISRRSPARLSPRQRELLAAYGYPYVMDEFRFHLTLSGRLAGPDAASLRVAAGRHFAGLLPIPFRLEDICLFGEAADGRFHLLHRYPLSA